MANKPGRPATKNRWDASGNPNFRRCGVYLETSKWEVFNLIVSREGSKKNDILETLIEGWMEERMHRYPDLVDLLESEKEELVVPDLAL